MPCRNIVHLWPTTTWEDENEKYKMSKHIVNIPHVMPAEGTIRIMAFVPRS